MELCKTKPQNDNKLFLSIITKQAQIYFHFSYKNTTDYNANESNSRLIVKHTMSDGSIQVILLYLLISLTPDTQFILSAMVYI